MEKLKFSIRGRRELRLILPFVAILLALVLLSDFSIDILSAARFAYVVRRKSCGVKGRKMQVITRLCFTLTATTRKNSRAYERAIAVPLGDRQARLRAGMARGLIMTRPRLACLLAAIIRTIFPA